MDGDSCSNNTNKLSPQERQVDYHGRSHVQIIQINLVLKNLDDNFSSGCIVQIIQINLVLKNRFFSAPIAPTFK